LGFAPTENVVSTVVGHAAQLFTGSSAPGKQFGWASRAILVVWQMVAEETFHAHRINDMEYLPTFS